VLRQAAKAPEAVPKPSRLGTAKPKPQDQPERSMSKMDKIVITRQQLNEMFIAFFDISGDHVGNESFHHDVKRVGDAILAAHKEMEGQSCTSDALAIRAEEILSPTPICGDDNAEHRFVHGQYGLVSHH
jgi:hypothetical protein